MCSIALAGGGRRALHRMGTQFFGWECMIRMLEPVSICSEAEGGTP